jgi:hypothetical protein
MELILYAMPESNAGRAFEKMLTEVSVRSRLTRFYSLQRFVDSLLKSRKDDKIVVTVIERPREFIVLHSLLMNNSIENLIIVCDETQEWTSLAHELRPRFLAHTSDVGRVKAVVEKMLVAPQGTILNDLE